jgi:hypothetical protein
MMWAQVWTFRYVDRACRDGVDVGNDEVFADDEMAVTPAVGEFVGPLFEFVVAVWKAGTNQRRAVVGR